MAYTTVTLTTTTTKQHLYTPLLRSLALLALGFYAGQVFKYSASMTPQSSPTKSIPPFPQELLPCSKKTAETEFAKLHLFITTFPGGFDQDFRPVFIRTLQFFWPKEHLWLTVVLDETVYTNDTEKEAMTARVKSFFDADIQDRINVRYNPNTDPQKFGPGWDMQQMVGFWANNFTDAEYIGIVDDDTLFTRAVQPIDIFDKNGRPRTICRYVTGTPRYYDWKNGTHWALGRPGYVNAMNYFPVVIHRKFLPMIRQHVLQVHPEFPTFDDFFQILWSRLKNGHSQFEIMFQYLWDYHRDAFKWHLEAENGHQEFPDGFPIGSEMALQYPYVRTGSPAENGVSLEMLQPFPRIAVHGSWIPGARLAWKRGKKVVELMRRGYCFSQPFPPPPPPTANGSRLHNNDDKLLSRRCGGFSIATDINIPNEWLFELFPVWPKYDPEGAKRAHFERMRKNLPHHDWLNEELVRIFDEKQR